MKLEVGKKYLLNNSMFGKCTRMEGEDPLAVDNYGYGPFVVREMCYHQDGTFGSRESDQRNHGIKAEVGTLQSLDVKAGDVVQCVVATTEGRSIFTEGKEYLLQEDKTITCDNEASLGVTISEFFVVSRAEPEYKTFGGMTPEEQGALLLAHHNEETIEFLPPYSERWEEVTHPIWNNSVKYRVKPTPSKKTVDLSVDHCSVGTVDLVDGKPDFTTIVLGKTDD